MRNQRAWIHCRVSDESLRQLLHYQEKRLVNYCESENLKVVGITKEIGLGKDPNGYHISKIKTMIRRNEIDYVVVYDWTRLLIFEDLYKEFKLYCDMNGVEIIDLSVEFT